MNFEKNENSSEIIKKTNQSDSQQTLYPSITEELIKTIWSDCD